MKRGEDHSAGYLAKPIGNIMPIGKLFPWVKENRTGKHIAYHHTSTATNKDYSGVGIPEAKLKL
jgi:hypothetical protein